MQAARFSFREIRNFRNFHPIHPIHPRILGRNILTESHHEISTKAERLIEKHETFSALQAYKNLKLAYNKVVPAHDEVETLVHLNFLLKRIELYRDDDLKCFYHLDGVGFFNEEIIEEIIQMCNLVKAGEEIPLNYSYLCTSIYKDVLGTKSYKQTVMNLLNKEKEQHLFTQKASFSRLSKRAKDFLNDMLIQRLVSSCEPQVVERFFPVHGFDLLHRSEDANILQTTNSVVRKLGSSQLLPGYKRSSTIELLNSVAKDVQLQSHPNHVIHQALCELSKAYTYEWNDYVLITLANRGIFPKGFTFGEGLRLKQEKICIQFLAKEVRLIDEAYRNEILSKCTDYGWLDLPKAIQKFFGK